MSTVPTTGSRATSPGPSGTTRSRFGSGALATAGGWRPNRDQIIDAAALLVLSMLATLGLTSVYDGPAVMVVGLVGVVIGLLVAWFTTARGLSPLATLGVAVVAFLVGSGPAVPDASLAGVLPGPATPAALLDGLIRAWKDLLTTAPPVSLSAGLGVVPYVGGFIAGLGGGLLAWRTVSPLMAVGAPAVTLVGSFLFGDQDPVGVVAQGGGFLVVAMAWSAQRANRAHRTDEGIYWPRVAGAAVMLGLLVPVGWQAGPAMPFTGTDRTVLREEVVPPFNAADYPSPLAGLRAYRKDPQGRDRTFLVVDGLPAGAVIRLATMDTYDGVVWTVSGDDTEGSGRFKRVGAKILPVPPWEAADVAFTIPDDGYTGVWVPSVGTIRSVSFSGADAEALTAAFRYNPLTGTAATTYELAPGNRYSLDVRLAPDRRDEAGEKLLRADQAGPFVASYPDDIADLLGELGEKARQFTSGETTAYDKALTLEKTFQDEFFFTDDLAGATGSFNVPAGHSIGRLDRLVEERAGNAEQYAAAMALMAQQVGLPSRVVMGFVPEGAGRVEVKGTDATAWVEIHFAEHGWVAFHPTPDEGQEPPEEPPPLPQHEKREQQPLPPVAYIEPPPTIPPTQPVEEEDDEPVTVQAASAGRLPAWAQAVITYGGPPVGVMAATAGLVIALKALRRRRRRTKGSVVDQINGAWLEAVDRLRDLGHPPEPASTRRELAAKAADTGLWPSGPTFAAAVDAHMFSAADPASDEVISAWSDLDAQVQSIHAPFTRRQRLRATVSTASLRPSGRRRPARLPVDDPTVPSADDPAAPNAPGNVNASNDGPHGSNQPIPASQRVPVAPTSPPLAGEAPSASAEDRERPPSSVEGQDSAGPSELPPTGRPAGQ